MEYVSLAGLEVSRLGLGCMGMSAFYTGKSTDDAESIRTIHRALDLGVTFFDTAEIYGPFTNEELLARALAGRWDRVVVASKFGLYSHRLDVPGRKIDSHPDNIRVALEGSLRRLGVDHIDLYYQHRVDPAVPIEEVVGVLGDYVQQGKIRHIGLSEASASPFAGPTRCTRSRRCNRNTRCGPAIPRPWFCLRCVSSASASFRIRRWAAAS